MAGAVATATNGIWATLVLMDAGLPTTKQNIDNMLVWMSNEEPVSNWADRNNPLNASLGTDSTDGTGSYPNLSVAAAETANMLKQANMSGIYNALKTSAPPADFGAAVIASPWAGSHYEHDIDRFTGAPPSANVVASGVAGKTGLVATDQTGQVYNGASCSQKGTLIDLKVTSLTYCQGKALVGGLLVGAGAVIMGLGVVLLLGRANSPAAALRKATRGSGGGVSTPTTDDTDTVDAEQIAFAEGMRQGQGRNDARAYSRATGNPAPPQTARANGF